MIAYLVNFLAMKGGTAVPSEALEEGDGVADSPADLAALGITPEEIATLARAPESWAQD